MTAKISAIIAQYIGQETRIIIPEVGTLIRRKESGEIIFMEMLKKNDGALVQLIVNALDVSPSKATEITNRYIGTVKQQLETNRKFIIDGVGVLLARREGGIDFSFNPFAKSLPEPTPTNKPVGTTVARPVNPIPPVQRPAAPAPQPKPEMPKPQPKPATPAVPVPPAPQPKAEMPNPQPKPATPVTPAPQPKPAMPKPEMPKRKIEEDDQAEAKKERTRKPAKKAAPKVDILTIVAILAAIMAVITLLWGFTSPSGGSSSKPKKAKESKVQLEEYVQPPTTLDEAIDSKALYQG